MTKKVTDEPMKLEVDRSGLGETSLTTNKMKDNARLKLSNNMNMFRLKREGAEGGGSP